MKPPRKLPKELPKGDPKFANITRPLIGLNCDTQARKKSNQSKPKDKAVVKVSSSALGDTNIGNIDQADEVMVKQNVPAEVNTAATDPDGPDSVLVGTKPHCTPPPILKRKRKYSQISASTTIDLSTVVCIHGIQHQF